MGTWLVICSSLLNIVLVYTHILKFRWYLAMVILIFNLNKWIRLVFTKTFSLKAMRDLAECQNIKKLWKFIWIILDNILQCYTNYFKTLCDAIIRRLPKVSPTLTGKCMLKWPRKENKKFIELYSKCMNHGMQTTCKSVNIDMGLLSYISSYYLGELIL